MQPEKRKAALAIILGKMAPKSEEPAPEKDGEVGREAAMSEFIDAVKSGDAKGALAAWDSLCDMGPMSEPKMRAASGDDWDEEED